MEIENRSGVARGLGRGGCNYKGVRGRNFFVVIEQVCIPVVMAGTLIHTFVKLNSAEL